MVPFGILLANDNGSGVSLQFGAPQFQSTWQDTPFSPKSRLDSRLDLSTFRTDSFELEEDEFDCVPPYSEVMDRTSYYSIALDECEKGCPSAPTTLPLGSLTAEELSDGKLSLPISQRSKVSFSKQVECFEIDTHHSYSDEEYDSMWYTPQENRNMRYECVETVQIMAGQAPLEAQDEVCFRGLECKTGHPLQARSSRKALTRKGVLEEQAFFRDLKVDNPEAIAEVSRQHSAPSVAAAIQVAQRDHAEDCDQWMYHYDEDEWTYSNELVKRSWLHAALPIAPKLSYFNLLRSPITV